MACGDHGNDKIVKMEKEIENGKCLVWTGNADLPEFNDAYSVAQDIDVTTPSGI